MLSGALTAEDEEEVEAELEALVAASEPASTLPEVPVEEPEELLPSVPTHEPQGETKTIYSFLYLNMLYFFSSRGEKGKEKGGAGGGLKCFAAPGGRIRVHQPYVINVTFLFCL